MAYIRRLTSGRWQAVIRRKGYPNQFGSFSSRQDAKRWATDIEADIDKASFVDRAPAEQASIGALIDRYIDEVASAKKSAQSMVQCLRFLRQHFGSYSLAALQPSHIVAYRDQRITDGRAGATVVKEINTLSRLIDTARCEWGLFIPANPCRHVRRPSVSAGRERRLSPDEERRLMNVCNTSRSPMLSGMVRVALETGMRLGELLRLRWPDVNIAARTARLCETKNGEQRTVPLPMPLSDMS